MAMHKDIFNFLIPLTLSAGILFMLTFCGMVSKEGNEEPDQKPNILVLLADDLGYGDLGCYGSQSIETPNIDALANEGIRFTRFYAGSAVCSPSRACLLTGNFPLRYNIRKHFDDNEMHLPVDALTLPEILKEDGYTTAHIGKWHLGGLRPVDYEARAIGKHANPGPLQHGFDYYLANIEGAPVRPMLIKERKLYREGGKYLVENEHRLPERNEHWTEIKVSKAIGLLDEWKLSDKPFYLQIWFDVPHTPYEPAPEPHLSKYKQLGCENDQLFFRSMVSHLDEQIGRLISHLKQTGQYDNTLIMFTSDNGPAYQGSPGPFKGGKTDLHEGGIRVPGFFVWNGHIKSGTHTFQTGHFADFLPTVCEINNIDISHNQIDGRSLLPVLKGEDNIEERILLWQMDMYAHFQNQGAKPKPYSTAVAVKGNWKMLADSLTPVELFNMVQDHREIYNLLGMKNELEKELSSHIENFFAEPRLECCE